MNPYYQLSIIILVNRYQFLQLILVIINSLWHERADKEPTAHKSPFSSPFTPPPFWFGSWSSPPDEVARKGVRAAHTWAARGGLRGGVRICPIEQRSGAQTAQYFACRFFPLNLDSGVVNTLTLILDLTVLRSIMTRRAEYNCCPVGAHRVFFYVTKVKPKLSFDNPSEKSLDRAFIFFE